MLITIHEELNIRNSFELAHSQTPILQLSNHELRTSVTSLTQQMEHDIAKNKAMKETYCAMHNNLIFSAIPEPKDPEKTPDNPEQLIKTSYYHNSNCQALPSIS